MKDLLQMLGVFTSDFAFDYHIINVHLHDAANQWLENLGHQSLIRGPSVFESKWHDFVTVEPVLLGDPDRVCATCPLEECG